ncbi:hypothetical protein B566_EDAN010031 [Ephemera danica]|nr:hypothetical protein B566_EDAN010031 [Ephemera danica]
MYNWTATLTTHRELFPGTSDPMSPLTVYLTEFDSEEENVTHFEELLRMLLSFWSYPPLFLILLRVELDVWDPKPLPHRIQRCPRKASKDMTLITRLLIKIGGAVPLGTRYYKSLKNILQVAAKETGGGIPTLRSLSRAAFRATVKKTCPTGLDFSEYRVLCQGEMVPLPPDI